MPIISGEKMNLNSIVWRTTEVLKSNRFSDCSFRVGSTTDNRKVFEGHKLLLSMASPVFEAMFYGQLPEKEYPIDVSDIEPELFSILMTYIYTDQINIVTFDQAIASCYAAQKYMLPAVVDHCVVYINNNLCGANVCRAYEFANFFDKKELTDSCIQLMKSNIISILDGPAFLDITINTLKDIFHMNDLALDTELSLYNALERYATNKAKGLQKDDGGNDDYDVFRELLKTVRFLSMTPKEFADGPGRSKLLQQDEKFAILMNIASDDENNIPMPEGFTTNKFCREFHNTYRFGTHRRKHRCQ